MDSQSTSGRPSAAVSRRQFLGGAGAVAGLAGLLPGPVLAAITSENYSSAVVLLELNGVRVGRVIDARGSDYLVNYAVAGQDAFGATALAPAGGSVRPLRLAVRQFTPALLAWVNDAYAKGTRASGAVVVGDAATGRELFRQQFDQAALTGIELESLDATAGEALDVTLELSPQAVKYAPSALALSGLATSKARSALRSNFRLVVQGADKAAGYFTKVGVIATRRGITADPAVRTEFLSPWSSPAFTVQLRRSEAGPFYDWLAAYQTGRPETRAGQLQLLSADFTAVLATVQFSALGIARAGLAAPNVAEFELQPTGAIGWDFKGITA